MLATKIISVVWAIGGLTLSILGNVLVGSACIAVGCVLTAIVELGEFLRPKEVA